MARSKDRRPLVQRLQGGLARRVHALWKQWSRRGPEFPAEAALDWLIAALNDSSSDLRATCIDTLLDYGCPKVVSAWAELESRQEPDSEPFDLLDKMANASSIDLAKTAAYSYKQHDLKLAYFAFRLLESRQTKHGNFPSPSKFSPNESPRDRILTVKHYLDAAQLRVAASFQSHGQSLPHTIDPSDGRMVAVCDWMRSLPTNAAVADVGCGSGRFLIHLAEQFPEAQLTGIDPCPALLDRLPSRVRRHEGTLLRTRLPEATFDGAFAVESLEHCLVAQRGIAEMCRIVRPGGRVLIIDKHRSKQALSQCKPWERWFYPHELTEWMQPFCNEIRVEPVSHSEGLGGAGIFLAAIGTRRET